MEDYLLECLVEAVKAGDEPEKRRKKAMNTAAWDLLDKPWKGLLLVALDKEEGSKGDSANQPSSRRMRNRGRRGRSKHSTNDWVEKVEGLISSKAAPGYRLSAMLVQRARLGTDWNASWDAEVEKLRDFCAEGVHPVWPRLGKESPLLAEMAIYPETVISNEISSDTSEWVSAARFDPQIRSSLAAWLESTIPFSLS